MTKLRTDRPFIIDNIADVIVACFNTNVFPSVKMAQAILESGWGKGIHAQPNINNLYGIKANPAWLGPVVSSTTSSFVGTNKIYPNRAAALADGASATSLFRVYSSYEESHKDHILFLQQNSRYTTGGVFTATTPEAQALALQNSGYAGMGDTTYSNLLIQVINNNGLKQLDEMIKNSNIVAEMRKIVEKKNEIITTIPEKEQIQVMESPLPHQSQEYPYSPLVSTFSSLQQIKIKNRFISFLLTLKRLYFKFIK